MTRRTSLPFLKCPKTVKLTNWSFSQERCHGERLGKGVLLRSKPKEANSRTALWELRHHYCFPFPAW